MKKVKIVFFEDQLVCGGAEQALFDLIGMLDKECFEASIYVQYEGGAWVQKFRDAGIPLVYRYTGEKVNWNPVALTKRILRNLRLKLAFRKEGQGVLNVCVPDAQIAVSYSSIGMDGAAFSRGVKSVLYVHGDVGTNGAYRQVILDKKKWLPEFDKIVCVSKPAMESFMELTGLRENVVLLHNPINSDHVKSKAQALELPECGVPMLCAVGRLCKEKAYDRLIRIHKRLLDQGVKHKLTIVGSGPEEAALRTAIDETQTGDSVILAGYQENPYPYMKQSKFLVISSVSEGLPVISMEALCLGIPIVASVPSVAEAFGDEACGLITGGDDDSLEEGIRRMLTDEAYYAAAKAAAERRSAAFDGRQMMQPVENMLLELVKE